MKMCEGCTWNLNNQLAGFNTGVVRMLKTGCDKDFTPLNIKVKSCLQWFCIQLMEHAFDTNGVSFSQEEE